MKSQLLTSVILACFATVCHGADNDQAIRRAVVKVIATQGQLNLANPWHRSEGVEVTGSGIWLGDRRILTNAHCVERNIQVSIQTIDSNDRIPATVKLIAHAIDLAVLEIENDEPFRKAQSPEMVTELPKLRTTVRVYGFPEGGDSLSVTEGIISRIEYTAYYYNEAGLRMQIDAAVNRGNSGGPVLSDGKLIGLTFAKMTAADNIGYVIPAEEIAAVLKDGEDSSIDGKYLMAADGQRFENASLRRQIGVPKEVTGVLINSITSKLENYPLRLDDVLTHIEDQALDNSGQASLSDEVRVAASYFINKFAKDGRVSVKVWRKGAAETIEIPLERYPVGVQRFLKGRDLDWFMIGPFVLGEATADYFQMFDTMLLNGTPQQRQAIIAALAGMQFRKSPLLSRRYDRPAFDGEQMLIVLNWLPHRISTGYVPPAGCTLKSVNGKPIQNARQLVEVLRDSRDEFLSFEFHEHQSERLVFSRQDLLAATKDLMDKLGIPRQGSPSLMEVWNTKPTE